jgi:hypothetical protein
MVNKIVKRMIIGVAIAVALVVIVAAISLVIALRKPGSSKQRSEEQRQEGVEFGKAADQKGCMTEGLKRGGKIGLLDISAQVENDSFVKGCLQASQPTPGFCNGVPSGLKNILAEWDKKQCDKIHNVSAPICEGIFKQQIYFCDPKHNPDN